MNSSHPSYAQDDHPAPALPVAGTEHDDEHEHGVDRGELVRIVLVAAAVVVAWLLPWRPLLQVNVVALVATLAGGYPIFREALEALKERRMTMELSMTIALVAALAIGESFTAAVIVLFVLVAEVLEHMTVGRGRRAICSPAPAATTTESRPLSQGCEPSSRREKRVFLARFRASPMRSTSWCGPRRAWTAFGCWRLRRIMPLLSPTPLRLRHARSPKRCRTATPNIALVAAP